MAEERLVCSNHFERIYLEEVDEGERVQCPECGVNWPNFLRYPVQPVANINTGQLVYRNVITGEEVTPPDVFGPKEE